MSLLACYGGGGIGRRWLNRESETTLIFLFSFFKELFDLKASDSQTESTV